MNWTATIGCRAAMVATAAFERRHARGLLNLAFGASVVTAVAVASVQAAARRMGIDHQARGSACRQIFLTHRFSKQTGVLT